MYESMESFTRASDAIVRFSRVGRGSYTLLLLHGYGESLDVFESFAGQLGKEFDVISLDLPGSGLSTYGDRESISVDYMSDVVAELLSAQGVDRYGIIAHSMGGYVAASLLEKFGNRIEGVVMMHSLPVADSPSSARHRAREIELLVAGKKEMLVSLNPMFGFSRLNANRCNEEIEECIEQYLMTDDEALIATLRGLGKRPDRMSVMLSYIDGGGKVLFLRGASDPYIPDGVWEHIEKELPGADYSLLECSAHMGFIEEQDKVLQLVKRHFAF